MGLLAPLTAALPREHRPAAAFCGGIRSGLIKSAVSIQERGLGNLREMHGVKVDHGARTYSYVEDVDVAIITGMTLTTDSLTDIVDTAKRHDTRVLMFAETGANMGEEYTGDAVGVDTCVSEPFPFYIFQGLTTIEVYRAKWLR